MFSQRQRQVSLHARPTIQEFDRSLFGDRFRVTKRNERPLRRRLARGSSWSVVPADAGCPLNFRSQRQLCQNANSPSRPKAEMGLFEKQPQQQTHNLRTGPMRLPSRAFLTRPGCQVYAPVSQLWPDACDTYSLAAPALMPGPPCYRGPLRALKKKIIDHADPVRPCRATVVQCCQTLSQGGSVVKALSSPLPGRVFVRDDEQLDASVFSIVHLENSGHRYVHVIGLVGFPGEDNFVSVESENAPGM